MTPLPVLAPAVLVPVVGAEIGAGTDPVGIAAQLGVGGVLVYFAARVYRIFEEKRTELDQQSRADIRAVEAKLEARHAADVEALRREITARDDELRETRAQLIEALRTSRPSPKNSEDPTP